MGYFLDSNALSIKKSDLKEVGGFDASFVGWGHEDTELGYRLEALGFQFRYMKGPAVAYHQYHPSNKEIQKKEAQKNWERLTQKYNISGWYHPIPALPVVGKAFFHFSFTPSYQKRVKNRMIHQMEKSVVD